MFFNAELDGPSTLSDVHLAWQGVHRKMELMECSETSAIRTQTPGNYPKENTLHIEHGESLISRIFCADLRTFSCPCFHVFDSLKIILAKRMVASLRRMVAPPTLLPYSM